MVWYWNGTVLNYQDLFSCNILYFENLCCVSSGSVVPGLKVLGPKFPKYEIFIFENSHENLLPFLYLYIEKLVSLPHFCRETQLKQEKWDNLNPDYFREIGCLKYVVVPEH